MSTETVAIKGFADRKLWWSIRGTLQSPFSERVIVGEIRNSQ
jgi:hypothetical protein